MNESFYQTLKKYGDHTPECNTKQDWTEAEQALADTPTQFRDHSWNQAVDEMNDKKNTCTCGFWDELDRIKPIQVKQDQCKHKGFVISGLEGQDTCSKCGKQFDELVDDEWLMGVPQSQTK